jgi:hypothetical protein
LVAVTDDKAASSRQRKSGGGSRAAKNLGFPRVIRYKDFLIFSGEPKSLGIYLSILDKTDW